MDTVIIIDDEINVLNALVRSLCGLPINIKATSAPLEALDWIEQVPPTLILCDQRMPIMQGTELLAKAKILAPKSIRVILSGYADFDVITKAFNRGIIDQFIAKPSHQNEIKHLIEKTCLAHNKTTDKNCFHGIWSQSPNMHKLFQTIGKVSTANIPIFIYGETGTGKELVANAIHKESARCNNRFVAINCANFSESLMESQLFGHKKGAFTGATHDSEGLFSYVGSGTLFLDEVISLPLNLQAKLLRVLQERKFSKLGCFTEQEFKGQIISASNKSLNHAVAQNEFREDLKYRLEVVGINLPPLNERREDIVPLLLRQLKASDAKIEWSLSPHTIETLTAYPWPGNVRQLINLAQYLSAINNSNIVNLEDLPPEFIGNDNFKLNEVTVNPTSNDTIQEALKKYKNNRTHAAKALGISRMTLWRRLNSTKP